MLTELQKKIVLCKPEINKPVFVLCGTGCGKTYALNERAKLINFLYYAKGMIQFETNYKDLIIHQDMQGYEEIVFEQAACYRVDLIISLINYKKVIICTTPMDFIEVFANRLKGEYGVISGYNIHDNEVLQKESPQYINFLKSLNLKDRKRLYEGVWFYE